MFKPVYALLQASLLIIIILTVCYDYGTYYSVETNPFHFFVSYLTFNGDTNRILLGDFWFGLHRGSLQILQPMIERHIAIWLWDPVFLFLLQLPLATIFLILSLIMLILRSFNSQMRQ